MEGVLQRTDTIEQLTQQLEQSMEKIKDLEGDMQTMTRENVHLKQKVEVEKFKGDLDQTKTKAKMAGTLFEKRLDDNLGLITKELSMQKQKETDAPSSASKKPSKKRKK